MHHEAPVLLRTRLEPHPGPSRRPQPRGGAHNLRAIIQKGAQQLARGLELLQLVRFQRQPCVALQIAPSRHQQVTPRNHWEGGWGGQECAVAGTRPVAPDPP